jgi:hypothetical protein
MRYESPAAVGSNAGAWACANGVAMIGLNWKKSLVVAGAVLALAGAVPALTQAHTQDVMPPTIAMTETPVVLTPVKTVSTKKVASKKLTHKKIAKKASTKHKVKKHKKTGAKKHTV